MNEDRITGNAEKLVGQVQEGVGQLTSDAREQIQGRVKQVEGAIGDLYGQAKQTALACGRAPSRTMRAAHPAASSSSRRIEQSANADCSMFLRMRPMLARS